MVSPATPHADEPPRRMTAAPHPPYTPRRAEKRSVIGQNPPCPDTPRAARPTARTRADGGRPRPARAQHRRRQRAAPDPTNKPPVPPTAEAPAAKTHQNPTPPADDGFASSALHPRRAEKRSVIGQNPPEP